MQKFLTYDTKMKILEISVGGYKNLGKTKIQFGDGQITALIAPNNYGKSNLLEGLKFAYDFIHSSAEVRTVLMGNLWAIPINKFLEDENFYFEVVFVARKGKIKKVIEYAFEFAWKKNIELQGSKIISERLRVKEDGKAKSKFRTYLLRNSVRSEYQSSPSGRCDTQVRVNSTELALDKLRMMDSLFYSHIIHEIYNLNFTLPDFMEAESSSSIFVGYRDVIGRKNFAQFIYNLRNRENHLYELFVNSLIDLIPNIESITPSEFNSKVDLNADSIAGVPFLRPEQLYDLRIKEKNNNQSTGVRFLSKGTRRIIMVLASTIEAVERGHSFIAFEELEDSIHPHLLQRLLMILKGLAPDVQILISSHSPYLVQYLPVNCVYFGLPNDSGVASFSKIKTSKHKTVMRIAAELDLNLGDYLFDLMSDIVPDKKFLEEYFESQV